MRRTTLVLAALAASLSPVPAMAEPVVLKPSSEWKLREYDDKCRMIRTFGAGEDAVTLWLDQGGLTQAYNLTLIGRALRHPYGPNLSLQFAPEPEYSRNYIYAESSKGRPVITLFGVRLSPTDAERALLGLPAEAPADAAAPRIDPVARNAERAAAITTLRLGRAVIAPLVLETGTLAEPLGQLQACAVALERRIGVNTALAATPPQPINQAAWAGELQKNYPSYLLRAGEEAKIDVRLTVPASGKPSFCEVPQVEGLTSFNDTACLLLLRHATFEPARNAAGEPMVARFPLRISFVIRN